ncbi:hypothetical protein COW36_19735 [bacterium (Candidatus Blackallbacteria) CG17_big_fil_post_rev_8_21_14_2_50_48_46]|uniref:Uncharacterized protein n=1 Tax=bacterium (Candidatus Blackallbacteria) CG17_big_fil_post_rev_8_21_14_2_50_48_46 TaxID=2014261 RepID=A0A2M7FZQ0_9BACT|nr:MAG: hypothetical protein COW64_15560 [bacterium (Candidatus Blackallbacteria) CG18_big_fil_WC_8_21_14_2_50_49_26]PIW14884.1 MAG: hypothetical protein COW36_19735 [bacterium (Candidatus Blackallbacteria) CG17_big_fil_post_rev_8_21_14_2_50_48_46]PIW44451.1 MAG: hypothetical protein COW20_24310 [bacterium (Candidatus Blackallbacteria) CG13_big_fil_rev_8_21_14_2_50_49_14]
MRVILQKSTPSQFSREWEIHKNYYLRQGAEVFLSQDVPYNITSNPAFIAQIQSLIQALVSESPQQGPLRILELGAGLGLFALQLLQAFADTELELEYWLTDLSKNTLQWIKKQAVVQPWLESGQLKLLHFDAQKPEWFETLDQKILPLSERFFSVIISNYHFSTLPTAVLYKNATRWHEKQIQIETELNEPHEIQALLQSLAEALKTRNWLSHLAHDHPQVGYFKALETVQGEMQTQLLTGETTWFEDYPSLNQALEIQMTENWRKHLLKAGLIDPQADTQNLSETLSQLVLEPFFSHLDFPPHRLIRREGLLEIDLENYLRQPKDQEALLMLTQAFERATVGYPCDAIHLVDALSAQLQPGGLWIISDKAYAGKAWMQEIHKEEASHHGESLSHPVNTPLLEALFQKRGYQVRSTQDEIYALQTLAAQKHPQPQAAWVEIFERKFEQTNRNEESHTLLEAGHHLLKSGLHEQARRCLIRALRIRPGDASLLYLLAVCMLQQEDYLPAWEILNTAHNDCFELFNFAILRAETCRLLESYPAAIPHYLESIEKYGAASIALYNLGLCYLETDQTEEARKVFQQAQSLDPEDPEIQEALEQLSV